MTLKRSLTRWLVNQRLGKAASTRHYYWETVKTIRRIWRPLLLSPPDQISQEQTLVMLARMDRFSASRWNTFVMILRATVPACRAVKRRPVKLTRPPPPTREEFARLLAECYAIKNSRAGLVVDFLAHTGLRISAARAVRWADVHEDRIEYIAKGGRRCAVPIVNGLSSVLDRLRGVAGAAEWVLPRRGIRTALRRASARAGVRRLNYHDFRHLFITRCIESGVDIPTIARWVGHKDGGALLAKRYFHLLDNHSRAMASQVRIATVARAKSPAQGAFWRN